MYKSVLLLFVFLILISVVSLGQTTWTGTTDSDWHRDCNWNTNSIPACGDDVIIPSTTNKPNVSSIAHCRTIEVQSSLGARLDITGTGRLDVGLAGGCSGAATDNGGCVPTNLLPNPSFEDRSCCPSALAQMNCVNNWINASSGGSTDYFNTCGFTSPGCCGYGPPPSGLPDGTGYLGFLDTRTAPATHRKEYAGVCLTGSLTASQSYTFDFYIANSAGAYGITVAIFGNTNCANMPNAATTCPTSWGTGWVELGSVAMTPNNTTWQMGTINFTAGAAYTAIIVGANCSLSFSPQAQRYFYLDNLALY